MKRVCYWCNTDMGQKEGQNEGGLFYSMCDECARRLRLDERLPELLQAVADLRKQNAEKQNQTPTFLTDPRLNLLENEKQNQTPTFLTDPMNLLENIKEIIKQTLRRNIK